MLPFCFRITFTAEPGVGPEPDASVALPGRTLPPGSVLTAPWRESSVTSPLLQRSAGSVCRLSGGGGFSFPGMGKLDGLPSQAGAASAKAEVGRPDVRRASIMNIALEAIGVKSWQAITPRFLHGLLNLFDAPDQPHGFLPMRNHLPRSHPMRAPVPRSFSGFLTSRHRPSIFKSRGLLV